MLLFSATTPLLKSSPFTQFYPKQKTAIGKITLANTLTGHSDTVWFVAISPDGQTIVSSGGTRQLWNLRGELRRTLSGHFGSSFVRCLSPKRSDPRQ